jgi:WD40 repeat protein
MLQREIEFCFFKGNVLEKKYDQHLLVRGTLNESLNKLIRGSNFSNAEVKSLSKRTPALSLKLERVFGFSSFDKRASLCYVHRLGDPEHKRCERQILYFVSRVAILYDPETNCQRFYENHRFKITCMAVHADGVHVITG